MKLTPLTNLFVRGDSRQATLYSGGCSCCCCVLAPIGSFIAEWATSRKFPERKKIPLWLHTVVNVLIFAAVLYFAFYVASHAGRLILLVGHEWPVSVLLLVTSVTLLTGLFYIYSFFWLGKEVPRKERVKKVLYEVVASILFFGLFFFVSIPVVSYVAKYLL